MLAATLGLLLQSTAITTPTADVAGAAAPISCPKSSSTRYYPAEAARQKVEGEAIVTCEVSGDRRFANCHAVSETPADFGFGQEAVVMAECLIRPKPGASGTVTFPIRFKLPAR